MQAVFEAPVTIVPTVRRLSVPKCHKGNECIAWTARSGRDELGTRSSTSTVAIGTVVLEICFAQRDNMDRFPGEAVR